MMNALQALVDNGCSDSALDAVLADLVEHDGFEDQDDRRCCLALAWYRENEGRCDPDDCAIEYGDVVCIAGDEYRVLSDDEADIACEEYIEQSLWAFNASFLSCQTGIDESVFEALADKCEGANDAIRSIIDGTCKLGPFVENAVSTDGRGHFLSHYDSEDQGHGDYFLYRVK